MALKSGLVFFVSAPEVPFLAPETGTFAGLGAYLNEPYHCPFLWFPYKLESRSFSAYLESGGEEVEIQNPIHRHMLFGLQLQVLSYAA